MAENNTPRWHEPTDDMPPPDEGGLRAPPGLGFWGKAWWWFHFLILVKIARLRFIGILVLIGLVIVKWDTILAYYDKWTRPEGKAQAVSPDIEYFCPMHPTVIRDNPKEKCPICFMPLSKRKKGEAKEEALPPGIVNRVQLSPYKVVLAGIQTWKVTHLTLNKEIATVGFVEFNERKLKQVAARVKARIDKLYVSETGQMVHEGQELASLYSPELIVTMQNLIDANRAGSTALEESTRDRLLLWGISNQQMDLVIGVQNMIDAMRRGDQKLHALAHQQLQKLPKGDQLDRPLHNLLLGQRTGDPKILKAAREELVKLGMHDDQVADILETGKAIRHLIIRSPIHGHIIKKYVEEGQYVEEGSPLYRVADLATVWIEAQVYESDLTFLPTTADIEKKVSDLPATAIAEGFPGETFRGKLTFVYPHVNPSTRTVVARFELENPNHKLRPGTTATVKLIVPPRGVDLFRQALAEDSMKLRALSSVTGSGAGAVGIPLVLDAGGNAMLHQGWVLAVPEDAVIDTGSLKVVYRQVEPGEYEGVKVELGPRMVGPKDITYYPVLRGLQQGDLVVTAGSFLVDAATRLNPAAGSIYFAGSGGKEGPSGVSAVRPSTPQDEEAKVKAAFAKLPSDEDRHLAAKQYSCPVLKDSRLGLMGTPVKVVLQEQPVFLCCESCRKDAFANPRDTLAKVEKLKKVRVGSAPE